MIPWKAIISRYGERPLFQEGGQPTSFSTFASMVEAIRERMPVDGLTRLQSVELTWQADAFARFLGMLEAGAAVLPGALPENADLSCFGQDRPLLILRTGGTTGAPRHAVHAMARFLQRFEVRESSAGCLLVLYAPDHVAGLDAFFRALYGGSTLVVPEARAPEAIARAIGGHRVQVLPATPSFLQFLLLSGALEGVPTDSVRIIPHGAEPMPPALRERIRAAFPQARLVQRFGMTELGALPVREDPEDPQALFLETEGHAWRVIDGELWIQCPARMLGTLEEGPLDPSDHWHPTGDLAETTPRGSIRILGRRESLINVGGEKVVPERVEALLLEQPGVRDASVYGIRHALTGQAVAARVVGAPGLDIRALQRSLRSAALRQGLPLAAVPTHLERVEVLGRTAAGKRSRRPL